MNIIEFVGVSGCGKSTLCEQYIHSLNTDKKIFVYSDIAKKVSTNKRKLIYLPFVFLNPFRWKYISILYTFASQYDNVSVGAIYILISLYDTCKFIKKVHPDSLVILDEGFIQNMTSIPHLTKLKDDVYYKLINYIWKQFNMKILFCDNDNSVVIERLRKRGRRDRFNMIEDNEELNNAINIKRENIKTILKCINSYDEIDTNNIHIALEKLQELI